MKFILPLALLLSGCSWLTPSHVQDVTDIVNCIIVRREEPPSQIAEDCALSNINQVVDILATYNAAHAADLAKLQTAR